MPSNEPWKLTDIAAVILTPILLIGYAVYSLRLLRGGWSHLEFLAGVLPEVGSVGSASLWLGRQLDGGSFVPKRSWREAVSSRVDLFCGRHDSLHFSRLDRSKCLKCEPSRRSSLRKRAPQKKRAAKKSEPQKKASHKKKRATAGSL